MAESGCLRDVAVQNLQVIGDNTTNNLNVQNTSTLGTRKFVTFAGSLASTDAPTTTYSDDDCLVELGTLDVKSANNSIVSPTKIFIHKAVILITTPAGPTLVGKLLLSATSGTATNESVTGTEIVGAGVTSFSDTLSAEQTITEIDINFDDTAGNYHVFTPNVTAAIEYKHLYACATTTVSTDATAGRFTVELEYSVL